jgi:hypothetical protein
VSVKVSGEAWATLPMRSKPAIEPINFFMYVSLSFVTGVVNSSH